jgi:hypothetical protein
MSIVIGLVTHPDAEGHFLTYLGYDSLSTTESHGEAIAAHKAFVLKVKQPNMHFDRDLGVGVCGAPAYTAFMRYTSIPPEFRTSRTHTVTDGEADEYVLSKLLPEIAKADAQRNSEMNLEATNSVLLLSFCGFLYTVDSFYNATRSLSRYAAIGMGEAVARGALAAYERMCVDKWTDRQTVEAVVDIVKAADITCGGKTRVVGVYP